MTEQSWEDQEDGRRLAHDLLQSISIIDTLTAALAAAPEVAELSGHELELIARETQVMAKICQAALHTSAAVSEVDLVELANRVVDRMQATSSAHLTVVGPAQGAPALVDEVEWERAVFNLLENAVRAAGEDGKVQVSITRDQGVLRVDVGDSGPGFGAAPGGRASLGLVTVTRLANRHGGQLELGRSDLGGALVSIVIPSG